MTPDQILYAERAQRGELGDLLTYLSESIERGSRQAYCSVNWGFLVQGRKLVPTPENRLQTRSPWRCVDFGTDRLIAMLEWLGRQIAERYKDKPEVKLLIGDLSAPRGGCLAGRFGRRGHSSHTNGEDADVAFLVPSGPQPESFHKKFEPESNWWLIKNILQNPYACVKVIFLDRRLIAKVAKEARGDPLWESYRPFLRHVRGHRNHYHIRVGSHSGKPGCEIGADPQLEIEDEGEPEPGENGDSGDDADYAEESSQSLQ